MRFRLSALSPPAATPARWLGAIVVAAGTLAAIVFFARLLGVRSPVFAFNLHFCLMAGAVGIDKLLAPRLAGTHFDVSPAEVRLYRRLGVTLFMRILQRIGWQAAMRDRKVFDGTRRTLASYEEATRHGENAHASIFLVALVPITWAALAGLWDAACWIGSMSVVLHAYPVMLQRLQRARLRSMLARLGEEPSQGRSGTRASRLRPFEGARGSN